MAPTDWLLGKLLSLRFGTQVWQAGYVIVYVTFQSSLWLLWVHQFCYCRSCCYTEHPVSHCNESSKYYRASCFKMPYTWKKIWLEIWNTHCNYNNIHQSWPSYYHSLLCRLDIWNIIISFSEEIKSNSGDEEVVWFHCSVGGRKSLCKSLVNWQDSVKWLGYFFFT